MKIQDAASPLMTPEICRNWIDEKVFPLQPETYRNQYPGFPGAVGLEIEMLPLFDDSTTTAPRGVPLQGQADTLAAWLRKISLAHGWERIESGTGANQWLMGVKLDQGDNLSFEPGGQLEFSSRPYHCLSEAINRTTYIQSLLDRELKQLGNVSLLQVGINPWHSVDTIGLQMQKPRYLAMNEFFSRISEYGPRMMRQTCTVQVNLDFGRDETTMAKRFLASMLMSPISGAIFNYSAFESGKFTGVTGLRQRVWRHLDPSRTDVPKLDYLLKRLDKKACVDTWYDFTMNARVVFSARQDYRVMHEPTTWAQWMAQGIDGVRPDASDFETHLSLLFPEVRARGFLEMRSVDCQSRVWQFVPAGWWTGLLYDDRAVDAVIELMTPHASNLYSLLQRAETGLSDPTIGALAIKLMDIADAGLKRLPACYFGGGALKGLEVFAEQFVHRGRVPANDIMDEYKASGRLDVNCFRRVESRWNDLMAKASDPAQSV
jgi:glutamate--cysteine ligase